MATYIRHYIMQAKPGGAEALRAALTQLMDAVLALPGCQGCELAVDVKNPENFHFSERWDSPEAHQAAGPKLPAAALDAMKGAIGAPPVGTGLNSLLAK